ncbi:alcohol dehydrogenase catalytic domain-containing protein [Nocardia harenae]|uniref:alcohol dehydrogenase catalytic domain-containing protein n=1 Tax=Nocardia harenae TaxID=358707 RepID=UPI0008370697|nr:alcohol dehydrogenase catalytic domain-containing protein [Nocardia harenae]
MDSLAGGVTRAAVWSGAGTAVREVPLPAVGPGETLVRVALATVCGSDLHTVTGRRAAPCPSVLGHEAVGRVVRGALPAGTRVVWSVTAPCGDCARCLAGFTAKCARVRKVGHEPFAGEWALSGTYAEHVLLPAGVTLVEVPDEVPDAVAAPAGCATATVMAALAAAGAVAGRRVLVTGAGMLGLSAAAACAFRGAEVLVADPHPERLALAAAFGGRPDDGAPVDLALEFSGAAAAVGAALSRLDLGGTLVLVGSVAPGPAVPVDPEAIVRGWLTVTGVHNYEPRHLREAVAFLHATRDRYPWASVVAPPVPLAEVATVLVPAPPGILRAAIAP